MPNRQKQNQPIVFHHLPCDFRRKDPNPERGVDYLKLYSITTNKDSADDELIRKIDSFVCSEADIPSLLSKYSSVGVDFLKETEETKKFKDSTISDSHNPYRSDNIIFARYGWSNIGKKIFTKITNENFHHFFHIDPCKK